MGLILSFYILDVVRIKSIVRTWFCALPTLSVPIVTQCEKISPPYKYQHIKDKPVISHVPVLYVRHGHILYFQPSYDLNLVRIATLLVHFLCVYSGRRVSLNIERHC